MPLNILADPRYVAFVERYHADPLRFAVEVTGMVPSEDQADLFNAMVDRAAKVSVVSGTGCFAPGTLVMRADGSSVAVEDVRVNDKLMGADGKSIRDVLELRRGTEEMFRITYADGTSHVVNRNHRLHLAADHHYQEITGQAFTRVTVDEWLTWPQGRQAGYFAHRTLPDGTKPLLAIAGAESLGEGEYYGFVLDGDGLFLGEDFTVLSNTGKTMSFGRLALWHFLCHPFSEREDEDDENPPVIGSNTYIGAPNIKQVSDGVWKEINDAKVAMLRGPHAWICQYFHIGKTEVYMRGYDKQWFISQIALQKGQSVGVAGKHRYWQLIIIDEAAGVPDEHFKVIDGTQTQGGNRTLLASQGVRNAGHFYDTHHRLSRKAGGSWEALRFSSENSPFVTDQWLKDRERECGGRNTVEYKIRALGLFAEDTSSVLLSRTEVEEMLKPRSIIGEDEPYGIVLLGDVGLGEYRDDSVLTVAKIIGYDDHGPQARRMEIVEVPIVTNSRNEIDFAGDVVNIYGRMSNPTLLIDNGGVGATVNKLIERSGVPVTRIDWGKPCFKKEYKERFYNQRACANVRLRDAIRQGRVAFPNGVSPELREKILDQGSRLPYHFAEAGGLKYVMMRKEDMRKEGIKSPDVWDTFSFGFLEGLSYIPAETYRAENISARAAEAEQRAADAFSDIG